MSEANYKSLGPVKSRAKRASGKAAITQGEDAPCGEHLIDASGKRLGRIASQAASFLMGKNSPAFVRHRHPDVHVHVTNASKLLLDERKLTQKTYTRYSGYPGGLKKENLGRVLASGGQEEVVRRAVYGMLPKNKLRSRMIKRLSVTA